MTEGPTSCAVEITLSIPFPAEVNEVTLVRVTEAVTEALRTSKALAEMLGAEPVTLWAETTVKGSRFSLRREVLTSRFFRGHARSVPRW